MKIIDVYKNCLPGFKKFAINVMGVENSGSDEEIALKGIEATDEDLAVMAHKCAVGVGGKAGSAMVIDENDMLAIFKACR